MLLIISLKVFLTELLERVQSVSRLPQVRELGTQDRPHQDRDTNTETGCNMGYQEL